jgi:endonuclease/exonuclease/phosphatase (EEP) superfamily protein YafD
MQKLIYLADVVLLAPIGVLSLASFLGAFDNSCELLSHLRPVWCLGALLLSVLLLVVRRYVPATIAIAIFVLNAIPLFALFMPAARTYAPPTAQRLKILQMNLWGGKNHDYERTVQTIRDLQPDLIGLSEVTATWLQQLKTRLPEFPYQVAEPNHGGICLLSRLPLHDGKVEYYGTIMRPRVFARVQVTGQSVTLIFAHPVIPLGHPERRNGELQELARETSSDPNPTILAGDLNCTPWSYYFGKLQTDGRLHDSETGFGFQPSWCVFWGFTMFPIDHCLMTEDIVTVSRRLGPPFGSDHLPVFTEVALPELSVGKHKR